MKVLFLATYFPKPGNPTIGTWALEQAKAFHESPELELKVVSCNPWFPKVAGRLKRGIRAYSDCPLSYNWNGVEVLYPKMVLYPFGQLDFLTNRLTSIFLNIGWFTISRAVSKIVEDWRPDVVYAHHTIPNGFFARKIHDKYSLPYIVKDHEMGEINACEKFSARRNIFSYVIQKSSLMVSGGEVMRQDMARVFPEAPCQVVHYGFNAFQSVLTTEESKSDREKKLIIMSCGMFYRRKNFPGLIQAFNLIANDFPEAILRICGDGPDAANVLNEFNKSPYKNRIELLGKLSHEEVNKQMAIADIFALIGWREPFGVVYLEAMAAGLPVIACNDGGFADIVDNGVDACLVPPQDVHAASENLKLLLADPILRKKVGSAGQEMALAKMTWAAITKKYIKIFHKAIAQRK
jgi:glycosyltransferase involved in cell wall biosynthesis